MELGNKSIAFFIIKYERLQDAYFEIGEGQGAPEAECLLALVFPGYEAPTLVPSLPCWRHLSLFGATVWPRWSCVLIAEDLEFLLHAVTSLI